MGYLNLIIELEGPVIDIRPRCWAAHAAATKALGLAGPLPDEFWRLWRIGAPDGQFLRVARASQVQEYVALRSQHYESDELIAMDALQPRAAENLRLFKQSGSSRLVTCGRNRAAINATLDRLDIWMHFDDRQALPEDRDRRVEALSKLRGSHAVTLVAAGTVPLAYAAEEAGCRVVGIKSGPTVPQRMRQVGVDAFFESLDDLADALSRHHPDLQRIGVV